MPRPLIDTTLPASLYADLQLDPTIQPTAPMIPLVPVDYVSGAVVQLASQQNPWGHAFHLVNPHPMPWAELYSLLCDCGYSLEKIPYGEWLRRVKQKAVSCPPLDRGLMAIYLRYFQQVGYLPLP